MYISYQENNTWVKSKFINNPNKTSFFIKIIDDNGKEHDIWNDYFYSTREENLNKLGI